MKRFTGRASHRKAAWIILSIILIFSLSSCGKQVEPEDKELGEIGSVTVSTVKQENTSEAYSPFSSYENELGYLYRSVCIPTIGVKFNIPEKWDAEFINARMLQIKAPSTDEFFPSASINIVYNYAFIDAETTPINFDKYFSDDLSFLGYQIDGDIYYEQFQDINAKTNVYGNDSITDESSLFSVIVREQAFVTNKPAAYTPQNDVSSIHVNINWKGTPVSMRSVVESEKQTDMEELLLSIMSSFTEESSEPEIINIKLNGITFDLPEEFIKDATDNKIMHASAVSCSEYSGMSVGVFDIKDIEADGIEFAGGTASRMTHQFMPATAYNVLCSVPDGPYSVPIGSKNIDWYLWDLSYTRSNDPFTPEDTYFGKTGVAYAVMYALPNNKALVLFTSAGQFDKAMELEEFIIRKSISF